MLRKIAFVTFAISIVLEIIYVFSYPVDQISQDAGTYVQMATSAVEKGWNYYPNPTWIHFECCAAPGWINQMILLLRLGLGLRGCQLLNVLFNLGIGILSFRLAKKWFGEKIACISLILFSIYPTWILSARILNTEIPYIFYLMLGLYLALKDKWVYIVLGGVSIAMANWIRPFLPIFLVMFFIIFAYKYKKQWRPYVQFLSGLAASIILIGCMTYHSIGRFEYQSLTQGTNALMCAWDGATGSADFCIFDKDGVGYLDYSEHNYTYWERNQIFLDRAKEWVMAHPWQWISLFPKKFLISYRSDSFYFVNYDKELTPRGIMCSFPNCGFYGWGYLLNHAYYYILMILTLTGLLYGCKKKNIPILTIFLYLFMANGASMVAPGMNRYHMVFTPFFVMLAAYALCNIRFKTK